MPHLPTKEEVEARAAREGLDLPLSPHDRRQLAATLLREQSQPPAPPPGPPERLISSTTTDTDAGVLRVAVYLTPHRKATDA